MLVSRSQLEIYRPTNNATATMTYALVDACNQLFVKVEDDRRQTVTRAYLMQFAHALSALVLFEADPIDEQEVVTCREHLLKWIIESENLEIMAKSYESRPGLIQFLSFLADCCHQILETRVTPVEQSAVDQAGKRIVRCLRDNRPCKPFSSFNSTHTKTWLKQWWGKTSIDKYAQYDEHRRWSAYIGGGFVSSSKDPDDYEHPYNR